MEERLWIAARDGDEEEASRILEENKGINVNWKEASSGLTALHKACYNGHDKIVAMLLARPDIGVNQKTILGSTPFLIACRFGRTTCIRLLLKDGRVTTLNEPTNDGSTPLWWAAHFGHLEVIKWWIASGREMDLGEHGNEKTDAIKVARKHNMTEVASLLEGFRDHPETTRHRVRKEIGWYDTEAADHFALTIFLCDELLSLIDISKTNNPEAVRHFQMISRLPMELQAKIGNITVGSEEEGISAKAREAAFKKLTKELSVPR